MDILEGIDHIDFGSKAISLNGWFIQNINIFMEESSPSSVVFYGKANIGSILGGNIPKVKVTLPVFCFSVQLKVKRIAIDVISI